MTGERASLRGNTLLEATVSEEDVGEVVNDVKVLLVVGGGEVGLGDGESDGVGDTLSERLQKEKGVKESANCARLLSKANEETHSGGKLNTVGDVNLGVSGGSRSELSEGLEVLHSDVVAEEVEHDVLESTSVETQERRRQVVLSMETRGLKKTYA